MMPSKESLADLPQTMLEQTRDGCAYEVLKLRCLPTVQQTQRLEQWLESSRFVYNHALHQRRELYEKEGKSIGYTAQQNQLPALKKAQPHLKDIPSQTLQDSLRRLQRAYDGFFRRIEQRKNSMQVKVGAPRFKKYGQVRSLTFPQVWRDPPKDQNQEVQTPSISSETATKSHTAVVREELIKLRVPQATKGKTQKATLQLPKIGPIEVKLHRPIQWELAQQVILKKTAIGHWNACIILQTQPQKDEPSTTNQGAREQDFLDPQSPRVGGIDVGLAHLLTTSDGHYEEHPHFLKKSERKLNVRAFFYKNGKRKGIGYNASD